MDFCPLDLQGGRRSRADSSMLSQLSFESGLAERLTEFTDGWSVNSGARSSKLVDPRLCHGVEAFEEAAGHVQQDNNSSSTSSELQQTTALPNRAGKRKAATVKDLMTNSTNSGKVSEGEENINAKCLKSSHEGKSKSADRCTHVQVYSEGSLSPKSLKASSKLQLDPPYPKQDYIHVRARRGQATDSHSLAERVRREKISERMKFLQDLVPGCSKVTGKAVMLDEIINYVQSLQRQIEFLSMKLAAVDPQLDVNLENLLHKELAAQARSPETTLKGPDPSAGYRGYQSHLQIQQQINNCNMDLRSVGTLCDAYLRSSMNNYAPVQLAPLAYADSFVDPLTQTLNGVVCDGDLQSIVHMGNIQVGRSEFFGQGRLHGIAGPGFLSPGFLKEEY